MKIQLVMKDASGVTACIVVEGTWLALDIKDVEKMGQFKPVAMKEIVQYYDNGKIYRYRD